MSMRRNPFNKKKAVVVGLVGAGLGLLFSRRARASTGMINTGGGGSGDGSCSIAPFTWNQQLVEAQLKTQLMIAQSKFVTGGAVGMPPSPSSITIATAQMLYPQGTWPPNPQAPANEQCLWGKLLDVSNNLFSGGNKDPIKNWPAIVNPLINFGIAAQPGKFLQIEYQKPPSMWAHSEIKAKPGILDVILTNANIPNTSANRKALYNAIVCSPWNDATLGVEGTGSNTGVSFYKPSHGRGISLNPVYADNLQRMLGGQPPRRRATSPTTPVGGSLPLIWIPDIERGQPTVIVKSYADGMSAINPPAQILELGLDNVPPGSYGCDPWRQNAAPLQY